MGKGKGNDKGKRKGMEEEGGYSLFTSPKLVLRSSRAQIIVSKYLIKMISLPCLSGLT